MFIKFWFGCLHFGHTSGIGVFDYDASVSLCLGWRGDHIPPQEIRWRRIYRLAWNWLPDRIYRATNAVALPPDPRVTSFNRLISRISGKPAVSANAENLLHSKYKLPPEYWNAQDSSRWTGRGKKFIGFGPWRHELVKYRSTRRSLMYVYLTGAKERANPNHILYVCPGALVGKDNCPSDWLLPDGTFKNYELSFVHGRCSVEQQLGELLVQREIVQKTNLIRRGVSTLGSLASTIAGRR